MGLALEQLEVPRQRALGSMPEQLMTEDRTGRKALSLPEVDCEHPLGVPCRIKVKTDFARIASGIRVWVKTPAQAGSVHQILRAGVTE
ncbi:hypothetical protein APTSU1_001004700 [Apodemus speciosus]|uniref:Uncharacterized protein n=1 Tax=Apodemus speciosus TaxID=105296 RepID=A0ABQ0F6A9_APOSI